MSSEILSVAELWSRTTDRVKDRVNHRSLWETMEKAVGITIEDGIFIIGLNARIFNEAGYLNSAQHRNAIETAASELHGRPLRMRVIEGESAADWQQAKKRDERAAASRDAAYERRDRESAAAQSWDTLHEHIARAYSSMSLRQLPQMKARFLMEMLYVVSDAMKSLYPAEPDEATERHLARVIDKIAGNADVPSAIVALELDRLRAWQQSES